MFSKNGSLAQVEEVLAQDVSVDITDTDGWTPLCHAARRGDADIVIALVRCCSCGCRMLNAQ
jgi:ankyrin repeat protein